MPHEPLLDAIKSNNGALYVDEIPPDAWDAVRAALLLHPWHNWVAVQGADRNGQPAVILLSATRPRPHDAATLQPAAAAERAALLLDGKPRADVQTSKGWRALLRYPDNQ